MIHLLALLGTIAFVPLDDRPVSLQLPVMLGEIAGERVDTPPESLLGRYLQPGDPDAILAWLNATPRAGESFVLSSDMLAYGSLIASRVPGTSYADAYFRLRALDRLRARYPGAWIACFGTIDRLAPTGVPADTGYFAPYPLWSYLQQYANLHDPPLPKEEAFAAKLRAEIGSTVLDQYLGVRARDLAVDRLLLGLAQSGTFDRLVLGQDDAGPVGLHVKDVRLLEALVASNDLAGKVSIEPGADELGMALVAHALARRAGWTPHVAVRYSTPSGALFQDPLEFAPISTAIDALIALAGGVRDDAHPDVVLAVRVPGTTAAEDVAFTTAMEREIAAGRSVALADLSFLRSYDDQAAFAQSILASGLAAHLDAYASWNTNANTAGTALAEAIAAGAGRRAGRYDALAHKTFTFMRFLDDYAFHDDVRPALNAGLEARGIDRTLPPAPVAAALAEQNRAELWSRAQTILAQLDPGYHIAAMRITLPWARTFETKIEVGIAPRS